MDARLIWQAYNVHDLDRASELFIERYSRQPEFFAIRSSWQIVGSAENKGRVVITTLIGAGIFIPLCLTMDEFHAIEDERQEKRSTSATRESIIQEEQLSEAEEFTRYCSYCGRLFVTDPDMVIIHCGSASCSERHQEYLDHLKGIKDRKDEQVELRGNGSSKLKEESKPIGDDFSLDTPGRNLLMGWIYFIQAENGLIKIGRSDNIERRFADLLYMSPVRLYLRHAIAAINYVRAEQWLHGQFATKRDHGEWFCLSEDDLEWAKGLQDYSLDRV